MAYAVNMNNFIGCAAIYVDKIPSQATLPVEQPITFEFAYNMKTAKALGLTMPATIVVRSDRVIESFTMNDRCRVNRPSDRSVIDRPRTASLPRFSYASSSPRGFASRAWLTAAFSRVKTQF